MASKFALDNGHNVARLLKYAEGPPYNIPAILDEALAPVREALEGLRKGECWCVTRLRYSEATNPPGPVVRDDDDHESFCERAYAVYESLIVRE